MRSTCVLLFLIGLFQALSGSAALRLHAGELSAAPFDQAVAVVVLDAKVIVAGNGSAERAGLSVYGRQADGTLKILSHKSQYGLALTSVTALVASPDQESLYLLGEMGDQTRVLILSFVGGDFLTFDAHLPVEELIGLPRHLAISPNGRHLCVSSGFGLAVYEVQGDSLARRQLFTGAFDRLLISPDGSTLYATGDLVTLRSYLRDPASGLLSEAQAHDDFSAFGLEVREARDLAQSPDGRYLYLLASDRGAQPPPAANDAVLVFENLGGGQLTLRSRGPGTAYPARAERIAVNPRNGALYLASGDGEHRSARLASFPSRDGGRDFYGLSSAASASLYSRRPLALAVGEEGDQAFLGSFDSLAVEAFSVAGFPGVLERLPAPGTEAARGLGVMNDLAIAPVSGRVLVTASNGALGLADAVEGQARFRSLARREGGIALQRIAFVDENRFVGLWKEPARGSLLRLFELSAAAAVTPLGPALAAGNSEGLWVSPTGRHLFLTGPGAMLHFEYRPAGPGLVAHGLAAEPGDYGLLRFSPDGKRLLVATINPFEEDQLLPFRFDETTGTLSAELVDTDLAYDARDFAFSPDGSELYVLKHGETYHDLRVQVRRRRADGSWSEIVQQLLLGGNAIAENGPPAQMLLDASGRRLAVLATATRSLFHIERDPRSGRLRLLEDAFGAIVPTYPPSPRVPPRLAFDPGGNVLWLLDPLDGRLKASRWICDSAARGELCLGENRRFRVEADWLTADGRGVGERVVAPSADSGLFYFFDADNWEMLVKVLDGCSLNGHFWFFAAATTDVGYALRVTDTVSGRVALYRNPLGTASPAITDVEALAICPPAGTAAQEARPVAPAADPELLVLRDRFELKASWRTAGDAGAARVAPFGAADSGIFYFFSENNWEMLVKVLDGCAINGHYWVLAAASTDVGFTLEVKDRQGGGASRLYRHPGGVAAPAIIDLEAHACASAGNAIASEP